MTSHEQLRQGLIVIGHPLPDLAIDRLLAYRDLLLKWNRTYNLTAITSPQAAIALHLLDSLAILPWLAGCARLLDVGSGGGLPGLPLAIALPQLDVTLIDKVAKKTAFQRQAVIELELENVTVADGRVEDLAPSRGVFDVIVSRAFTDLAAFTACTRHLLAPDGQWLAMKGQAPMREIAALPGNVTADNIRYRAPDIEAERHLVALRPATAGAPA
jgi:16S rRNA (guanine527-N7)-methyltransferase